MRSRSPSWASPGLNVVAVADSAVKNDPALVQKYVCAEVQATRQFTGPQAARYLTQSAKVQGVPGNLIVQATKAYPFIPLSQQLHWLGSAPGDTSSPIVKAYVQTGHFLVGQGRLPAAPSAAVIAAHVDPIMTVTTVAALDEVPEDLRLCARTLGASRRYTLLHVQIRSAMPGILTGMRISMAGAWSSIVAVELLAATSGLGFLIMQAGDYLDTALVFAGIITIAIAGLILDACLRGLLILADPSRRR